MLNNFTGTKIGKDKIILLCAKTLRLYDSRLVDHGERVAFIAETIRRRLPSPDAIDPKSLLLLCLFHDVGAFKTEEIDRMVQFESVDVGSHSLYGYLFLKYFTPLSQESEVILHHHMDFDKMPADFPYADCASLIHLADRVDILILTGCEKKDLISRFAPGIANPDQLAALSEALEKDTLFESIKDGSYNRSVLESIAAVELSDAEALEFLKMLVYTIDFKSKHTLVHSVTTTEISLYLAERCGFSSEELEKVFLGSFIHDVGKLAIPESILEYPGRLSPEQMDAMRSHVVRTAEIASDVLPPDIVRIAARHHERLDGSGYPDGISGEELTEAERIVAVADVFSALIGRRSYKDGFDSEKALGIMWENVEKGLLDRRLVEYLQEGCDEVLKRVDESSAPVLAAFSEMSAETAKMGVRSSP